MSCERLPLLGRASSTNSWFSGEVLGFRKCIRKHPPHTTNWSSAFRTPMATLRPFATSQVQQLCVKAKLNSTTELPILQKCLQKRLNFQQTQITHVSHNVPSSWQMTKNFKVSQRNRMTQDFISATANVLILFTANRPSSPCVRR